MFGYPHTTLAVSKQFWISKWARKNVFASSQIERCIPTFRDIYLHLLLCKKHFSAIFYVIFTSNVIRQGITANHLNLELSWRISWQLKDGNIEIHICRKLICSNKDFFAAIKMCFLFFFYLLAKWCRFLMFSKGHILSFSHFKSSSLTIHW